MRAGRNVARSFVNLGAKVRDLRGKFRGASGSFAAPERNSGRCAVRIFDDYAARLHAANAPGSVAKKHNVAAEAFDGEVFVNRADDGAFRLSKDGVERVVWNCAAACDRGEAAAAATTHASIDAIAMEVRAVASATSGDAFGEHFDDRVKLRAFEIAVGIGAADARVEIVFLPILGGTHRDNLLGENVLRRVGNFDAIEIALSDGANERGAFEEFIASGREDAAFRNRAMPVAGASDALEGGGDGPRGADLADEVNRADIDSELERRGSDEGLNFAGFEFGFGGEAKFAREAAVVSSDRVFAEALLEMMGDAFGQAARIYEDERGAMLANEIARHDCKFRPTFRAMRRGRVRSRELRRRGRACADGRSGR